MNLSRMASNFLQKGLFSSACQKSYLLHIYRRQGPDLLLNVRADIETAFREIFLFGDCKARPLCKKILSNLYFADFSFKHFSNKMEKEIYIEHCTKNIFELMKCRYEAA